jgi:hypothetical protein
LLGIVNKLTKIKSLLTSPSNVLPQVNFPANNLNFNTEGKYCLTGSPKKMALFDPTEGLEELISLNNLMLNSAKLVAVNQG